MIHGLSAALDDEPKVYKRNHFLASSLNMILASACLFFYFREPSHTKTPKLIVDHTSKCGQKNRQDVFKFTQLVSGLGNGLPTILV